MHSHATIRAGGESLACIAGELDDKPVSEMEEEGIVTGNAAW